MRPWLFIIAQLHLVLLEKNMEFSQSVQESFLPNSTPQHDNFVFAAGTYAAHFVGGDYYDFIPFRNEVMKIGFCGCFRKKRSRCFINGTAYE